MSSDQARVEFDKLNGIAEKARLKSFLQRSDAWIFPPLSSRTDLELFAEKILLKGVAIMAAVRDNPDIGMAAFYCNDLSTYRAYLTHLTVDPAFRARGLGKALLERARKYAGSMGM